MSDKTEHPPVPTAFAALGVRPSLLRALAEAKFVTPSEIQHLLIPRALAGVDLLGQARTGTGKTAAFGIPIVEKVDAQRDGVQAVVLAPTRELAIQVAEAFQKYAAKMPGFNVLPIYGGQSYTPQLKGLKRGAHVVVGTPGRVLDHVKSGALNLDALKFLVLDEGDEMLQMGFVDDIEFLFQQTPKEKQVALFTATLPHSIRRIAQTHMVDPREISVQSRGEAAPKIRQRYWMVSGLHKLDALTRVLESERFDAMLVFVRTKIETVDLAQRLEARGFAASALNGDMEQRQREQMIAQLKNGKIDILIATDVAARGLDVERISHVLNYDIPYDSETYVHRIGRTGRAGRTGDAILFVSPRERNMLRVIERVTKQQLEEMKMPSVADVNELRVVKFKEKITAAVMSGAGKEFQSMLEQVQSDGDIPAIEIAAALASMVQGSTPLFLAAKPEAEQSKAPPRIDGSVPTQTYRIEVGHAHGVLPGNIVGAIANEAGIEGKHIGHIDIREDHSYVDLPGLPDEMMASLQDVRVRGEAIRIQRVDSKPDKPKFSGQSRRPDRMAEASSFEEQGGRRPYAGGGGGKRFDKPAGEKRPYTGGGNRFDKAGEPRPFESRRSESRNYKGTPRFKRDDAAPPSDRSDSAERSKPPRFESFAPSGDAGGDSRPKFERAEKPAFAGKPRFTPGYGGKPTFGDKKPGGFKKKFVGKAAGAKGSYKGGKAHRAKASFGGTKD
jgi:ATP-dependent RNA helicase DeaD